MLAEKAGEAFGYFAFLPEGSARKVMFLPGELVHDDSVGAIEFLPVGAFHFWFGDETHNLALPVRMRFEISMAIIYRVDFTSLSAN